MLHISYYKLSIIMMPLSTSAWSWDTVSINWMGFHIWLYWYSFCMYKHLQNNRKSLHGFLRISCHNFRENECKISYKFGFHGPFSTMCNHSARYFLQLLLKVRIFIELTPLFFSNQKLLDYCHKTNVNIFILFLVKIQLGTDFS